LCYMPLFIILIGSIRVISISIGSKTDAQKAQADLDKVEIRQSKLYDLGVYIKLYQSIFL
jgi:hypothetical protein